MLPRLLRTPRADLEVGVAIPSGLHGPLSIAAAVLVEAGLFLGMRLTSQPGSDHVVVRVVGDGAVVGPRVLSPQVVPLC